VVIARAYHRGARVRGLIDLPFGAAQAGEHTCPRVVAAHSEILVAHRGDTEEARAVGAVELDMPRRAFALEVTDSFVYHVGLYNHPDDAELGDDERAVVAQMLATRLGFEDGGAGAGVQCSPVRHGRTGIGQDHLHVGTGLIWEDGRTQSLSRRRDFAVLSEVRREADALYGLTGAARRAVDAA